MNIDFGGRIVLITGATRGIGRQLADDFAGAGARLLLTGTHADEVGTLNESFPSETRTYHCVDFSDPSSLERFLDILATYERIDVCVNNAGICRNAPIASTRIEDWDALTSVNLRAPFLITRVVCRTMMRNGYGRIINVGSIFGVVSRAERSIYSVTKFGLRGLTAGAANDLAPYNILVNCVSPGFVKTELTCRILGEEGMREVERQIPVGRLAGPDDISRVILFLASDLNTYVTGQNIIVDGGFTNV